MLVFHNRYKSGTRRTYFFSKCVILFIPKLFNGRPVTATVYRRNFDAGAHMLYIGSSLNFLQRLQNTRNTWKSRKCGTDLDIPYSFYHFSNYRKNLFINYKGEKKIMKPQWYINMVLYLFHLPRKEKILLLFIVYTLYFIAGRLIVDFFSKPAWARFTYHKYPFLFNISKNISKFPKGYFSAYAKRKIKGNTFVAIPALISFPFATLYLDDISLLKPGLIILIFITLMTPTAFAMFGKTSLYRMIFDEKGVIEELTLKREDKNDERKDEVDGTTNTTDCSGQNT